jgi:hypothetical protein
MLGFACKPARFEKPKPRYATVTSSTIAVAIINDVAAASGPIALGRM